MFAKRTQEVFKLVETCSFTKGHGEISAVEALTLSHYYLLRTKENHGCVYVIGNGGSAGIASHFCTDLLKTLKIPAATLVDSNLLTCIGNDLGYEQIFSHQLDVLMSKNDLLVAISSSGKSQNILNAADIAKAKEAALITLSGFKGDNPLRTRGQLNLWLDACDYGLVETGHFSLLHTMIDTWQHRLPLIRSQLVHAN